MYKRQTVYALASDFELPNTSSSGALKNFEEGTVGSSSKATRIYNRRELKAGVQIVGPGIIAESASTTYLAPSWRARSDEKGNLRLTFEKSD